MNRQFADDRRRHEHSLELAATAIDFDLTSAETAELEAHVAICPHCVRRVAAMRADARVLRQPLTVLPSPRVDAAVHAAFARRSAQPRRLLLLATAALLLVTLMGAVAAGASLLLDRKTLPTTVVPTAKPSTPVTVRSPRPDTSPLVVGETWGTLKFPTSDVGSGWVGRMEAVTATASGLIAVGRPVCAPQDDPTQCRASVWTAVASEGWTRAPDEQGLELGLTNPTSGPEKGVFDVAAGPAGLVAIGFDYDPSGPAIWRSTDGQAWERVQVAFGASPADAFYHRITAVAASPQGYVIVGYVIDFVDPGPSARARAAAWTSPDGVTWTRAADTADMDVGPCVDTGEAPSCGGMRAVVATATGFAAIGQAQTAADFTVPSRPAAWTSRDGLTWTRSDTGLDFNGLLSGVTAGGPGLVAVGTICEPSCVNVSPPGVAATSRDGSTWTFSPVAGATELGDVAFAAGQTFALGARVEFLEPPAALQLWRSDDGIAWQLMPSLPTIRDATAYGSMDLTAADDRLVVVGWAEVSGADGVRNFTYLSPRP